jgi:hypothetical protein
VERAGQGMAFFYEHQFWRWAKPGADWPAGRLGARRPFSRAGYLRLTGLWLDCRAATAGTALPASAGGFWHCRRSRCRWCGSAAGKSTRDVGRNGQPLVIGFYFIGSLALLGAAHYWLCMSHQLQGDSVLLPLHGFAGVSAVGQPGAVTWSAAGREKETSARQAERSRGTH